MTEKIAKPEIRFKGFSDDWEQRKFSDCYRMSSGYAFKMSDYCEDGIGLINGESIQHGIINDENLNHLPEEFLKQYSDFVLKEGDIVVGLNRPITNGNLKIARIPSKYNDSLLYQRAGKIVYKEDFDKDFSYVLLSQEILKHTLIEAIGSDQPFISTSKLDKWQMMIPKDIHEQKQIGQYFSKLDNLITLYQRKYDNLMKVKKSMLEKMFPKNGETVPEIRFKGFSDDWEQRKLIDEVVSIDTGKSKFVPCDSGEYEILGSTSVIGYDNSYDYEGDFLLTARVGANAGELYRHSGKAKISDNTVFIQGNYLDFIYYALLNFDIKKLSFGTGQPLVKASELKVQNIRMPVSMKEREYIGNYFKVLDHLITLHQRKLEKLKNIKKACLEKMFV